MLLITDNKDQVMGIITKNKENTECIEEIRTGEEMK